MPRKLSHNGLVILRLGQSDPRETYAGLLWTAQDKGYKNGWVAHKFREIFGKWPKPKSVVEPSQPEADLQEWLGITRKRYRAKKKREEIKNGIVTQDYSAVFSDEGLSWE
jgi:hypothetical protein